MAFKLIKWTSEFSCHVQQIDLQHRHLINQINLLHESIRRAEEMKVIWIILGNLVEYARVHFMTEEFLLEKSNYDQLALHKNIHKMFVIHVEDLIHDYIAGDPTVAEKLARFLSIWLENHIMKEDKRYSAHLNKAGIF